MIVTISREFGAGAVEVAAIVAERCGLRLIIDELPQLVADRLGIERETIYSDEDAVPSLFDRLVAQLPGAMIELAAVPTDADLDTYGLLLPRVEHNIRDTAGSIDAVIMGRAAEEVLGVRWDVIRVFLHAPRPWRVARLIEHFAYTSEEANEYIDRVDGARARYLMEYYGKSWADARLYDLTADTSRMPINELAEIIISMVASRYQLQ